MKTHILILALSFLAICASEGTQAQIAVLSDLSFDRQASPGQTYEGMITIKNEGTSPTEVKVYQTDYSFGCDRTTRYDEAGSTPGSNAGWITFSVLHVQLSRACQRSKSTLPEVRAERRHRELAAKGTEVPLETVAREMEERDRQDSTRADSPLTCDETYVRIDTSELSIDGVVDAIVDRIGG